MCVRVRVAVCVVSCCADCDLHSAGWWIAAAAALDSSGRPSLDLDALCLIHPLSAANTVCATAALRVTRDCSPHFLATALFTATAATTTRQPAPAPPPAAAAATVAMPVSVPFTFTQTDDAVHVQATIHSGTVSKATIDLQGEGGQHSCSAEGGLADARLTPQGPAAVQRTNLLTIANSYDLHLCPFSPQ